MEQIEFELLGTFMDQALGEGSAQAKQRRLRDNLQRLATERIAHLSEAGKTAMEAKLKNYLQGFMNQYHTEIQGPQLNHMLTLIDNSNSAHLNGEQTSQGRDNQTSAAASSGYSANSSYSWFRTDSNANAQNQQSMNGSAVNNTDDEDEEESNNSAQNNADHDNDNPENGNFNSRGF
jgi:hypothetical protein